MGNRQTSSRRRWVAAATTGVFLLLGGEAAASHTQSVMGDPTAPWAIHIHLMDDALKTGNVGAALRTWHDAYASALGSRQWQGMLDVGDAYLRIGEVAGTRRAAEATARQAYLIALFRARQQGTIDGALRAAEAFAALGDRDAVEQCLRVAEQLAARHSNPDARGRVRAFAADLSDRLLAAQAAVADRASVAP